jgi:hypothetical protein
MQVRVHFVGRDLPVTAQLADISPAGCYFRGVKAPGKTGLAFGFQVRKDRVCLAAGQVLRVDEGGFAVKIQRSNTAFTNFIAQLTDYASFEATG